MEDNPSLFAYSYDKNNYAYQNLDIKSKKITWYALRLTSKFVKKRLKQDSLMTDNDIAMRCVFLTFASMILASKANHFVDKEEYKNMFAFLSSALSEDFRGYIDRLLTEDFDVSLIKEHVKSNQEAMGVYFLSCLLLQNSDPLELSYLRVLADTLRLKEKVKNRLQRIATHFLNSSFIDEKVENKEII